MESVRRRSVENIEAIVQIALGYEEIASLTVGDIQIVKNPPQFHVEQVLKGSDEIPDPGFMSHDEMVQDYVESTEGPDNEG